MVWRITPQQPVPVDPLFGNVSLLLHGAGANGSTAIIDSSPSPKTVTAVGNAQISTAQSKFGGSSIAFDGNGDYLTVPTDSSLNLGLFNEPFTIELWFYRQNSNEGALVGKGGGGANWNIPNGWQYFLFIFNGLLWFQWNDNLDSSPALITTTAPAIQQWHHCAVSYNGSTTRLFLNGVPVGTSTAGYVSPAVTNIFRVGLGVENSLPLNGYINDLRITKGVARYTANFTPPTAPFPDA